MEKFEYKGMWWTPENLDHQVAGIIKFDPVNGAILETLGESFERSFIPSQNNTNTLGISGTFSFEQDIICGVMEDGKAITLYKCIFTNSVALTWYTRVKAQVIFVGHHFEKEEDIVFNSFIVVYSKLKEWVGIGGFVFKVQSTRLGHPKKIRARYDLPKKIAVRIKNLKIIFDFHLWSDHFRFGEYQAKQTTFMELTPAKPLSYDDYQSQILYPIRNLLSLGTQSTVIPLEVRGIIKSSNNKSGSKKSSLEEISIFYVAKGANVAEDKYSGDQMLFTLSDLSDNLELYLENWFTKFEKLRAVHDLYFGLFYIPSMYVHLEFLTLAQALESYHRIMHDGTYMTIDDYKLVVGTLNSAIPKTVLKNHKDSLKSRIKYGNEFSLRTRLKLILALCLKDLDKELANVIKDRNLFIDKIVNTRNYLTHYSKESEAEAITDDNQLQLYSQKMKLILKLCFLIEMGIPPSKLRELVKNR